MGKKKNKKQHESRQPEPFILRRPSSPSLYDMIMQIATDYEQPQKPYIDIVQQAFATAPDRDQYMTRAFTSTRHSVSTGEHTTGLVVETLKLDNQQSAEENRCPVRIHAISDTMGAPMSTCVCMSIESAKQVVNQLSSAIGHYEATVEERNASH